MHIFFSFWTFKKMAEGGKREEIMFKVLFNMSIIDWDIRSTVLPPQGTAGGVQPSPSGRHMPLHGALPSKTHKNKSQKITSN